MVEITPEPDAMERAAILAALAADDLQELRPSPWAETILPRRDCGEDEP